VAAAVGMTAVGFLLFDTPIGRCGTAWGERGVLGVQLPEANDLGVEFAGRLAGQSEVWRPLGALGRLRQRGLSERLMEPRVEL